MNKSPFADLNAITKKIELENISKGHLYPVTIVMDRYDGCYSKSKWLAIQCNSDDIPDEIGGGDPEEESFWRDHDDSKFPIGKGATPNEAYEDLKIKAKKYYDSW
jgi:hypothetical protein